MLEIYRCAVDARSDLAPLIDRVFVESKGRSRSMKVSFPNLYFADIADNVYIACRNGVLLGATTVRKFDWWTGGGTLKGAMIGLVCTDEAARGLGVASRILEAISCDLEKEGADFGVLWTTIHGFYERLGWKLCDVGGGGRLELSGPTRCSAVQPVALGEQVYRSLEAIRERFAPERVIRASIDYRVVPPSVNHVELYQSGDCYALVGNRGLSAYLYEMVGDPTGFMRLIMSVASRYEEVYVNENPQSPFGRWLTEWSPTVLGEQQQTMWRQFTARCGAENFCRWYIPYFDRI